MSEWLPLVDVSDMTLADLLAEISFRNFLKKLVDESQ